MQNIILLSFVIFSFLNFKNENIYNYVEAHSPFGLPENIKNQKDFVIFKKQFLVYFNESLNMTNFVLYNLNSSYYGNVTRYSGGFIYDTMLNKLTLPDRITHSDYTNSGYDRGHLVRSEERTLTKEDNKSTFLTTNILPQNPSVNSGIWYNLELYCEKLCKEENKNLYIVTGGIFKTKRKLNSLTIPDEFFKIIIVLDAKTPYKNINYNDYIIAVKIPNVDNMKKQNWINYTCSVDELESILGYDFFPLMKDDVENRLEKNIYK
jgi:endonuclease G